MSIIQKKLLQDIVLGELGFAFEICIVEKTHDVAVYITVSGTLNS